MHVSKTRRYSLISKLRVIFKSRLVLLGLFVMIVIIYYIFHVLSFEWCPLNTEDLHNFHLFLCSSFIFQSKSQYMPQKNKLKMRMEVYGCGKRTHLLKKKCFQFLRFFYCESKFYFKCIPRSVTYKQSHNVRTSRVNEAG